MTKLEDLNDVTVIVRSMLVRHNNPAKIHRFLDILEVSSIGGEGAEIRVK
jgi:hypothetical protein